MGYLCWGHVQQRLTEYYRQTDIPTNFYTAARDLLMEHQYTDSITPPAIRFDDWDINDLDDLASRLDSIPVNPDTFREVFQKPENMFSLRADPTLDVLPIRIASHQQIGLHAHDSFELLYVIRGKAWLHLVDGIRPLETGTFCLVSANTVHDMVADHGRDDNILFSISLSEHTVETTLSKLLQQSSIITDFFRSGLSRKYGGYLLFPVSNPRPALALVRSLFHECYGGEEFSKVACSNYLELLLIHLLRLGGSYQQYDALSAERREGIPILAVLQHIQREFRTTSLVETAKRFHFECDYLSKQLKSHTGKTYIELVKKLKIDEAKRLLQNTTLSLDKVAESCGYSSPGQLSRSFLADEGMRPSAWRKQHRP